MDARRRMLFRASMKSVKILTLDCFVEVIAHPDIADPACIACIPTPHIPFSQFISKPFGVPIRSAALAIGGTPPVLGSCMLIGEASF